MPGAEVNVLETVKAPRAHHEIPESDHHSEPGQCRIPLGDRVAGSKMDNGCYYAGTGWNRHADKIFLAWTARIRRFGIIRNVEPRQPASSRHQKEKAGNRAQL